MLFSQNVPNRAIVLRVFMFLGLVLKIIWTYVSARQYYVLENLRDRLRRHLPEYATTRKERERVRWPLSNLMLLVYLVPITFIFIWIVLQFAV